MNLFSSIYTFFSATRPEGWWQMEMAILPDSHTEIGQPFEVELLYEEIKFEIISHCDIAVLQNLSAINKAWNKRLGACAPAWKELSIECNLPSKDKNELFFKIKNLYTLSKLTDNRDFFEKKRKEFIKLIPNIENVKELNDYFTSIDKIKFWSKLSKLLSLPAPNEQFTSLEALLLEAKKFKNWSQENSEKLKNLTAFRLTDEQLTSLPSEIAHLSNLELLDLSFNFLSSLPPEIGNLTSLKVLLLAHNRLSRPPDAINGLNQLNRIDLYKNPI